ncbi:MAG: elongation factor P hydroxylase [Kangiellaceae bacterium]|nr:elongation factor P hydroxylase [Kangiellaceae bacterium]
MLVSDQYHDVFVLAELFNQEFSDYAVLLKPGADEPFYQAVNEHPSSNAKANSAIIYSTQDYFSSALHELAHWCVAGAKRRQLDDYGYWYEADGRSAEQQALFYKVEVKPQALEWAFSLACNIPFRISNDNLNNNELAQEAVIHFRDNVHQQLAYYFTHGFSGRSLRLIQMLCQFYRQGAPIQLPDKEQCLL